MYEVDFSVWIHVAGTAELDFEPESPDDLTDYIFSDECGCEIYACTLNPNGFGKGYMDITKIDEDEEE